jgi:hypothetical protein
MHLSNQRGAAPLLLLFAMSGFSVLGVAAITTHVTEAPPGVGILHGVEDQNLTIFVAPLVVPNAWRLEGGDGAYAFELPVLVPEHGNHETGSSAAWHEMRETSVPGMTVCCEARPGVCAQRKGADTAPSDN